MSIESNGLPWNREAERAVLGLLLSHGDQFRLLHDLLAAGDFHLEAHRRIWYAIESLAAAGAPIQPASVAAHLSGQGQLDSAGGGSALLTLDDGTGGLFGGEHFARIVHEQSIRRRAIVACQKFQDELLLGGESAEVLTRAEGVLRGLSASSAQERRLRTIGEIIAAAGGISVFLQRSADTGVPSRFPGLNRIIGGFRAGEQWVIAARPSVGKTALATELLAHAAEFGTAGAMFSLEMNPDELIKRIACSRSRTDWTRFRDGRLDSGERRGFFAALAAINELPVVLDGEGNSTVAGIRAALTRYNAIRPVGLVAVDYLQLMGSAGRHDSRNDEVAGISRGLKLAARQFGVPFLVLSQLSRGSESDRRRPRLSDLRDSGAIEQDADGVIFLHPQDEGYGATRQVKLIVAKQRNGPTGEVSMVFLRQYARFEEATREEEEADDEA